MKQNIYKTIMLVLFIVFMVFPAGKSCAQSANISTAYTIKEKDLIPEGIIYDEMTKNFFVGSIQKHKIVCISPDGKVSDYKSEKEDGLYNVLGMKIDTKRRVLWVCSYAGGDYTDEKGCAGIFKYNLKNGKLIKKYLLDNKTAKHLFNDIIITPAGDAYFTDSDTGIIYTINHKKDKIEVFVKEGVFSGPNGIALSPDGKYIYVADSNKIQRIDMKGAVEELKHPDEMQTGGIDGLYFYKNDLIAVQNDFTPMRIVKFILNKEINAIEKMNLLCQDNPLVYIPTTGVVVKDEFYIIGNSQLHLRQNGKITDYKKLEEVRIVKIDL